MIRLRALLVIALAVGASACASGHGRWVARLDAPNDQANVEAGAPGERLLAYLSAGQRIRTGTQGEIVFHATDPVQPNRSFWVMLGPIRDAAGNVVEEGEGCLDIGPGGVTRFNLVSGYAYLIGTLPWLTSDVVSASTEGTAILVRLQPAASDKSRDGFVSIARNHSNGDVVIRDGEAEQKRFKDKKYFVKARRDPTLPRPRFDDPIANTAEVNAWIVDAEKRAAQLGIPTEPE